MANASSIASVPPTLIFVHGRSQENKDAEDLKAEWVSGLQAGLSKEHLPPLIDAVEIAFPYYGDTLAQLTADPESKDVPEVIVRGDGSNDLEQKSVRKMLTEILAEVGVKDDEIRAAPPSEVIERGPSSWEWAHARLALLDQHVPGASKAGLVT